VLNKGTAWVACSQRVLGLLVVKPTESNSHVWEPMRCLTVLCGIVVVALNTPDRICRGGVEHLFEGNCSGKLSLGTWQSPANANC
jgi:hypothetical protein